MRSTPLTRFLGIVDMSNGPFGVLGLPPTPVSEEQVQRALVRQLERVAAHPHGSSAEADEVRLTLHVAAAQLRDQQVQQEILSHLEDRRKHAEEITPRDDSASAPRSQFNGRHEAATGSGLEAMGWTVETLALQVLAHSGGWNAVSKRRLAELLHAHGRDIRELPGVLHAAQNRLQRGASPVDSAAQHPRAPKPRSRPLVTPAHRATPRGRLLLFALAALLAVSSVLLTLQIKRIRAAQMRRAPDQTVATETTGAAVAPIIESHELTQLPQFAERGSGAESGAVIRTQPRESEISVELQAAAIMLRQDRNIAMIRFESLIKECGELWPRWPEPSFIRVNQDVVDYLRDAARIAPDAVDRGAAELLAMTKGAAPGEALSAESILPAAWSVGMIARLQRERRLGADLLQLIHDRLTVVHAGEETEPDASFPQHTLRGMKLVGRAMLPSRTGDLSVSDPQLAWEDWKRGIQALRSSLNEACDVASLDLIEELLVNGPEPSLDAAAHHALVALLETIDVNQSRVARERVLHWLDSRDVTDADIVELTSLLAAAGESGGLPQAFQLSTSADRVDRMRLRDQIARNWGLPERRKSDVLGRRWAEEAQQRLQATDGQSSPFNAVQEAVRLASLSYAALLWWQGDESSASAWMREGGTKIADDVPSSRSLGGPSVDPSQLTAPAQSPDGQWAAEFISAARDTESKRRLLFDLKRLGGPLGPADAGVLAEAALLLLPLDIREVAQDVVISRSDEPTVIFALLQALPEAPRLPQTVDLLSKVTHVSLESPPSAGWMLGARRALVMRVIEVLMPRIYRPADYFGAAVGRIYELMVGTLSPTSSGDDTTRRLLMSLTGQELISQTVDPAGSARSLFEQWRQIAARYQPVDWSLGSLEQIDSRQHARRSIAKGPLQRFVAEQSGLCELMAFVVAAENPSRTEPVRAILNDYSVARRHARHAFQQILAGERAMLRLWLIRFGEAEGTSS